MTRKFKLVTAFVITILLTVDLSAQWVPFIPGHYKPGKERGDVTQRVKGQMEGNQIRATIFNFGFTGREGGQYPYSVQTPYEWPKNTGQVYLALEALMMGGEVTDNTGKLQHIIDVSDFRQSPEGKSWNLEPVPGYHNEKANQIATSVDPSTWPTSWPDRTNDALDPGWRGSWNGYFGKNKFNADQEMYYRASDDGYTRYTNYFPDSTDLTRKGMGIIVESRTLAWSQVLVEDALYLLFQIRNDGTKDIPKFGVTMWHADFVGGNPDAQDNISEYDILNAIAFSRTRSNRSPEFGNDPVGIVGVTFLETPGNAHNRIDDDGDSPETGPIVTLDILAGEIPDNGIDDNGNGLVDENQTHIAFGTQTGVVYADGVAQPLKPGWLSSRIRPFHVETNSPIVTQSMVDQAANNRWKLWPPLDSFQNGQVQLIELTADKIGLPFKDEIDNDGDGEDGSPKITQAMIDQATHDAPYYRYRVNDKIVLYNVVQSTLGNKYADGIDNNNDGAIDEGIDEGIDVMIDEARDNGLDDDYDWNVLRDDVGLDGVPDTGDLGEGDGKPTSGARFGLPGEPNIDVTDVHETDRIGITNAQYQPAGSLNIQSDATMWFDYMIPGKFYDPQLIHAADYDLFVSCSLFPLQSGQTEPFSVAVVLANGPANDPDGSYRKNEILKKRIRVQETYNNDYQFASAPNTPTLTALPGNNKVTLYWDDKAEASFDSYLDKIGGDGHNFEGYRIYRASDPAFIDASVITNGAGSRQFKLPIAQFDLVDGIKGYEPVGIEGIHFWTGSDNGLKHSFVDSTARNGFTYYYAITSYSKGFVAGQIVPAECPIRVSLQADGSVKLGSNVARIKPEAPSGGYVEPSLGNFTLARGSTSGTVNYNIVDINKIRDGHVYYITFEDTIKIAKNSTVPDTLTTKNWTLKDSTDNVIIVNKNKNLDPTYEQPLTDGFRLLFNNAPRVELDRSISNWNDPKIVNYAFEKFVYPGGIKGEERPNDYRIEFGALGFGTSKAITLAGRPFPSKQTNLKVYNVTNQKYIDFAFLEVDGTDGLLSTNGIYKDRIIFLEPDQNGNLVYTWWFYLFDSPDATLGTRLPKSGDKIDLKLKKPFLSGDAFRFVAHSPKIDPVNASADLDNIKVVPNPYVSSATWEPKNPYNSGRGPRSLHFTHLPPKCTIRIFTVNGELVNEIQHDNPLSDGTADWNMLTKDNLSISYGVYVYQIDAPGVGAKIGKFAVIK
ncbi:MAG: hypothetical protein NTX65_12315 [Ignavibacteriales bacterium]|nr:hypothetical protein [Ignavibacteriales bacterium]